VALRISSIGISSLLIEKERRQHGGEGTLVERRQRAGVATQVSLLHRSNTRGRAARMCLWPLSVVGPPELENDRQLHGLLICTCFVGASNRKK